MLAASGGYEDVVKLLINARANVNYQSTNGFTALMFAPAYGKRNIGVVTLLIDAGADVMMKDEWGDTARSHAIKNKCWEVAAILSEVDQKQKASPEQESAFSRYNAPGV
jgi:ankyrin repeat protein